MITVLTDLVAHLTQNVLSGTDQRLQKPFFDFPKKQYEATPKSYFIEAAHLLTFTGHLTSVFPNMKKMVLVNDNQWPKVHLVSNVQTDL